MCRSQCQPKKKRGKKSYSLDKIKTLGNIYNFTRDVGWAVSIEIIVPDVIVSCHNV